MTKASNRELARAKQTRLIAIVIAATMVLWLGAQFLGGQLGLPVRYVFLFDMAALAALFWALVMSIQIWRSRQSNED